MQRLPNISMKSLTLLTKSSGLRPSSRLILHPKFLAYSSRSFSTSRPTDAILGVLRRQTTKRPPLSAPLLRLGSRTLMNESPIVQQAPGISWTRMAWTAAGVAGAVIVVEATFNRDTGLSLTDAERDYRNSSFTYTGAGIILTAVAARGLFRSGTTFRVMKANRGAFLFANLLGLAITMIGVSYTPPERNIRKYAFWLAFNGFQAATLSPLVLFSPAVLSRAVLYTVGVIGSFSYIGVTATNERYLYAGGPLLAGATVVALSSVAPMILPMGLRTLAISEAIALYGGLSMLGFFTLYNTRSILNHARLVEAGLIEADPLRESIGLQLTFGGILIHYFGKFTTAIHYNGWKIGRSSK